VTPGTGDLEGLGERLDMTAMQRHLEALKLSRTYWPECLEVIEEMPRTASGKIQKFVLREQAKRFAPS
jgi:acyl-coenzyme A synthetase/AMP-(fatty) acid ligase